MTDNRLLVTDTQQQLAASRPMLRAGQRQRYMSLNMRGFLAAAALMGSVAGAHCAQSVATIAVELDDSLRVDAVERAKIAEAVRSSAKLCNSDVRQLRANVALVVKEVFPSSGIPRTATVSVVLKSEGLSDAMIREGQVEDSARSPGSILITLSCL
jgi:hypothetical protein